MRKFTCLTVGDAICIPYGGKKFYLDIREVQPNGSASIIETDCNVDFEEPLGYKESKYGQYERDREEKLKNAASAGSSGTNTPTAPRVLQKARVVTEAEELAAANAFKAFSGNAQRIDGKVPASSSSGNGIASGLAQPKPNNAKYYEDKFAGSKEASPKTPVEPVAAPAFQSRIGDKYSKKKTAVSAFTGTAHKF